ncbi:NAD kinase [Microbacter margulisiae]|uniref:NAD kinase n=1 Tax=Microbacter margulisiae TaxID=1350067 RepID=A0A7W5DPR5_9PORP|nr:NAD kinase [Microbacter margulisiae]MBB3186488.1 NAD+ kinase [Microbacter margulisiae]
MKILIFGNTFRPEAALSALRLATFLQDKHVDIWIEKGFYDFLNLQNHAFPLVYQSFEKVPELADFALSIGGDGTFLNTAMHIGSSKIPILGINTGRLGFLADVADNELEIVLDQIINNEYFIEERTVLELQTTHQDWNPSSFALNEIALLKQDSSSMIAIQVKVNGEELNTYRADGLIIATPTGSTAYSMSVGGPIVVPQANNFILAPVASHSLNIRPLIIPDNWELEVQVKSRTNSFLVALDGRSSVFDQPEILHIRKAGYSIRVVKQAHHTFFNTLKNKLMWGVDKRTEKSFNA